MKLKDAYSLESESEVVQSCPTLCATVDYRPPGSSVHGILQARTLEWVAISFSTPWKESYNQPRQHIEKQRHYFANKVKSESEVAQSCPTFATPWTVAHQAPLSMGFSRQEYWSGLPSPSPRDFPDPGVKSWCPALQADSCLSHQGSPNPVNPGINCWVNCLLSF